MQLFTKKQSTYSDAGHAVINLETFINSIDYSYYCEQESAL